MTALKRISEKLKNRNEDVAELLSFSFRDVFNGNIFTSKFMRKQYVLLIVLVTLSIIYISNRYAYERKLAEIEHLKKEVKDAKYTSLSISAELTEMTTQSNILDLLEKKNMKLKLGTTPPIGIE